MIQQNSHRLAFNPNDHMRQIKSKDGAQDYLDVKWRLVWFRDQCPQGTIDTEEIVIDLDRECEAVTIAWNSETRRSEKVVKQAPGYARFRAIVTDGKGGRATGTKSECAANFPDYIEKAETGAVGRALAMLGYGTQFAGEELDEQERIVDSPVDHKPTAPAQNVSAALGDAPASPQQLETISRLSQHLGKQIPAPATYGAAKDLLAQMSKEYNQTKRAS